jgi:tetratricopeptide (TPR) repeat protein
MNNFIAIIFTVILFASLHGYAHAASANEPTIIQKPLIERYVFDELKSLRESQQNLRLELTQQLAQTQLSLADRAISYTADTTNNIFYIITAAASLLVLLGWKSLRDIKENVEASTTSQIKKLIDNYEDRLADVESNVKLRSDQIIATQEEISNTNRLHSLWMRAGIEKNTEQRIAIYDEILDLQPEDVEALTYKADALLDVGESKWALSLSNQAIEQEAEHSFAYWQRACANANLGNFDEAMDDIEYSLELSPVTAEELLAEDFFKPLKSDPRFKALLKEK